MPGGQVETGESLLDALRREVEEESGCRIEIDKLTGIYSKVTPPEMVLHLFRTGTSMARLKLEEGGARSRLVCA